MSNQPEIKHGILILWLATWLTHDGISCLSLVKGFEETTDHLKQGQYM